MPKAKITKKFIKNQGKKLEVKERKEFITETGIFIRADQPHEWTRNSSHTNWRYLYHIRQTIQNLENLFVEEKDPKYLFEARHWQRLKDLLIYEGLNYATITFEQATINASSNNYNDKLIKKPKQPRARPLWIDTSIKTISTEPKTPSEKSISSEEEDQLISLYLKSDPNTPIPSPTQIDPKGKSPDQPIEI